MKRMSAEYRSTHTLHAGGPLPDALLADFRAEARARLARSDAFSAELLAREVLNNAAIHGNRGAEANGQILCAIRLSSGRLLLAVRDGGRGFDWRAATRIPPDDAGCSGRGLAILFRYATRVRFNNCGNAAFILKRFSVRQT